MGLVGPRLPELGGMTDAGFNRVVAMIHPWDFHDRLRCDTPWGHNSPVYCDECRRAKQRFDDWRASLPKARNKKQRKADAKRMNHGLPYEPVHCAVCGKRLVRENDYTRDGKRYCREHYERPLVRPIADWHAPTAQEIVDNMKRHVAALEEQTLHRSGRVLSD